MEDNKTQKEKIIKKVEKGEGKFGAGTVLKKEIEKLVNLWKKFVQP